MLIEIKTKIKRTCLSSKPLDKMSIEELEIERQIIDYVLEQKNPEQMEGLGALFG